jgi:hypothetical protein
VKKSDANPNATIQIDRSDVLETLVEELPDDGAARHAPPPLPPEASRLQSDGEAFDPALTVPEEAPPASAMRSLVWGIVLVLLVGGAIVGGLKVGNLLSPTPVASSPASVAPPPSVTVPPPAASSAPTPGVITIPTVELGSPR